jgi:glycerol-3-phosphate dehydrogenase subunit B
MSANGCDVLVIGEGLSGIMAAATAATQGAHVTLVSKGPGNFVLGPTCVDVEILDVASLSLPGKTLDTAVEFFLNLTAFAAYAYSGGSRESRLVPTILGTFQEVSVAPRSLWQADPHSVSKVAVVGVANLPSFDPRFLAERLAHHSVEMGLTTSFTSEVVTLPHNPKHAMTALEIANHIDRDETYRTALAHAVRAVVRDADLVILPGVLGVKSSDADIVCFEEEIGCAVCELATLPPSVPGLRLLQRLERRLAELHVDISSGFAVQKLCIENDHCVAVELETPGRPRRLRADSVILACGRFAEFLEDFPGTKHHYPANVFACGSLLAQSEPRHRNAISILTGYQAGLLASQQGVQYAGR